MVPRLQWVKPLQVAPRVGLTTRYLATCFPKEGAGGARRGRAVMGGKGQIYREPERSGGGAGPQQQPPVAPPYPSPGPARSLLASHQFGDWDYLLLEY